jgi:protein-disulfide isomerase
MRAGLAIGALALGAVATAGSLSAAPARRAPARAVPARPAPAARDWSRTVVATPEGGFRMGNPAARIKVIEYGSLTCPHCAAFSRSGAPLLVSGYVRRGQVNYEYRNFVLNGIDIAASLVARCSGTGFFRTADAFYATQPQWIGRFSELTAAQENQLKTLADGARMVRLAEIGGMIQIAARTGLAPARARACLADKAGLDRLGKINEAGQRLGVGGTPTFFVNGAQVDGITWAEVEPAIRRAGG